MGPVDEYVTAKYLLQSPKSCTRRGAAGGGAGVWSRGGPSGPVNDRGAESCMRGYLGWCGVRWLFPVCCSGGHLGCFGLGLLLREALVDYGNTPDNAYSQGVQE